MHACTPYAVSTITLWIFSSPASESLLDSSLTVDLAGPSHAPVQSSMSATIFGALAGPHIYCRYEVIPAVPTSRGRRVLIAAVDLYSKALLLTGGRSDFDQVDGRTEREDGGVVLFRSVAGATSSFWGCVATLKSSKRPTWSSRPGAHIRQPPRTVCRCTESVANSRTAHPPYLPLPDHGHRLISLNRSPSRVTFAKALLGLHSSFDRSMILLQDVVHVSNRPMSAAAAQGSFRFHGWNRRAVQACLIGVHAAGLRMRRISQGLAEQPSGRRGIAQR